MPAPSYGYIPAQGAALVPWAENFRDLTTATPAAYGLSGADATAIANVVNDFTAAFALSNTPATRTSVTIAATNAAKFAMLQTIRTYAAQIRLNPSVSDSDKLALGLRLPNNAPAPIPTPVTWPIISISEVGPLVHRITFADSSSPLLRAKPAGAIGLQLFLAVGAAVVLDPDDTSFYIMAGRQPVEVIFDAPDAGKIATYFARWITRKGLVGPWSAGIDGIVAS